EGDLLELAVGDEAIVVGLEDGVVLGGGTEHGHVEDAAQLLASAGDAAGGGGLAAGVGVGGGADEGGGLGAGGVGGVGRPGGGGAVRAEAGDAAQQAGAFGPLLVVGDQFGDGGIELGDGAIELGDDVLSQLGAEFWPVVLAAVQGLGAHVHERAPFADQGGKGL